MTINIGRSKCCDLHETSSREWLVTNGLGGYAAGTVAGMLTRVQHGLLVALSPCALIPQLLVAKIDEEVIFDERTYYLGTNEYQDGSLSPAGFVHLEAFSCVSGFPVFTYRLGGLDGIILEKRIWMAPGQNTTYIQYRVLRTTSPITNAQAYDTTPLHKAATKRSTTTVKSGLQTPHHVSITLLPFAAYRPYNQLQSGHEEHHFHVQVHQTEKHFTRTAYPSTVSLPANLAGCTIKATTDAQPYHILAVSHSSHEVSFIPTGVWYWRMLHKLDVHAGQSATDDLYLPGVIRATLRADQDDTLTVILSSENLSPDLYQDDCIAQTYKTCFEQNQNLYTLFPTLHDTQERLPLSKNHPSSAIRRVLPLTTTTDPHANGLNYLQLLLQAGNRFLAHTLPDLNTQQPLPRINTPTPKKQEALILSEYYGLAHRTRDTLIALPGLTLVGEHYTHALQLLRQFATYFRAGLLPDNVPSAHQVLSDADYTNIDTTLWYFYALDHYLQMTGNAEFLAEIFPLLAENINCYLHGTYHDIHVDFRDGLLGTRKTDKALTWMNASIHDQPLTPRVGKTVEVNALWYNALSLMHEWSQILSEKGLRISHLDDYQALRQQCKQGFQQRFWYQAGAYLYDVVDTPDGDDASIRPNQLFAIALRYPILETNTQRRQDVIDVVTNHLLTPYGLRTLSPSDPAYQGHMGITSDAQSQALHQGSVWPWLIGPYIDATLTLCTQSMSEKDRYLCQEYLWRKGLHQLERFQERFNGGILGMCEGVLDGDIPYNPGPSAASALSSAELLRVYSTLARLRDSQPMPLHAYQHAAPANSSFGRS